MNRLIVFGAYRLWKLYRKRGSPKPKWLKNLIKKL